MQQTPADAASVEAPLDASGDGSGDGSGASDATPDDVLTDGAPADASGGCDVTAIPTWASGASFTRTLDVRASAPAGGDGSEAKPFSTVEAGLRAAKAGDRVLIHAGTYAGGAYVDTLKGTASQPILVSGAPGEAKPVIDGGAEGLHLTDATYAIVADLEVRGQTSNALNVDDGGSYDTPAHHLVFRGLHVHDVASGNHDGLKMSGVDDAVIVDSVFERIGGQMVDMVGCHRVTVAKCTFRNGESVGVQLKGGCSDSIVTRSRFENAGPRGVNMGGSTGLTFFRPIDAKFEAARIVVSANVFVGGDTPFAYVGCDECTAAHNTIIRPLRWAARILQETVDTTRFVPCRKGRFVDNLVVVGPGISGETVNVGPNTDPASFTFANNLWFHTGNPSFTPTLPVAQSAPVYGDPELVDLAKPDAHLTTASPAIGKGLDMKSLVPGDHDGRCWKTAEAIGAFEGP